jgi:hypothetical protein
MLVDVDKLPCGPGWSVKSLKLNRNNGHEIVQLWKRNTLDGIKDILVDKRFANELRFRPERHWTGLERKIWSYSESWMSKWMW